MPKINVLPKSVAELIAAGEVVERPSSAVKELIENSIDAGATAISVEIKNGGVKYIRVTDNGCGIHKEDVRTAFISHATSKIKTGDDLDAIFTLGFRGEALPSIAAVSRLSMLTKSADEEIGTSIDIEGGEEVSFDDAGCPDGTTIIIRDLFFNTPARMKFLKKDVTEGSYISDIVSKTAISHPDIRFSLVRDGKQVLSTPGNGDLKSAVFAVFGKDVSESLIPCEYEYKSIKVNGFISRPLNNRPNRNLQYFYVNGRFVRLPVGAAALDEAYKNRIMVGKFPVCFLFINIPAGKIDVNVHPAKTEIRFSEDSSVFESIFYAAKSALNKGDTVRPEVTLREKKDVTARKMPESTQLSFSSAAFSAVEPSPETKKTSVTLIENKDSAVIGTIPFEEDKKSAETAAISTGKASSVEKTADTAFSEIVKSAECIASVPTEDAVKENASTDVSSINRHEKENTPAFGMPLSAEAVFRDTSSVLKNLTPHGDVIRRNSEPYTANKSIDITVDEVPPAEAPLAASCGKSSDRIYSEEDKKADIRIVGEIFKTYILVEEESKLLIIDKHAAHERMIYNKLVETGFSEDSQLLLTPVSVTLSGKEYAAVIENLEIFEKGGFLVEDFGDRTVIVRECPVTLQKEDVREIVAEIAGELLKGNMRPVPEKLTWLYHSTACRAAIKAGDALKDEETEAFVKMLLADDSIRYCPHGRPVIYELTKHEIEKQFGRI